jgi:hypothetical protein
MNAISSPAFAGTALVLRDFLPNAAPSLAKRLDAEHRARQLRMGFVPPRPAPTPTEPVAVPPPPPLPRVIPADRISAARDDILAKHAAVLTQTERSLSSAAIIERVRKRIYVRDIQEIVCAFYGIDVAVMLSPRRPRRFARPRQIAMFLARELTPRSYPDIGSYFGGRDHTTVLHAVRLIGELSAPGAELADDVAAIRAELTAIAGRAA